MKIEIDSTENASSRRGLASAAAAAGCDVPPFAAEHPQAVVGAGRDHEVAEEQREDDDGDVESLCKGDGHDPGSVQAVTGSMVQGRRGAATSRRRPFLVGDLVADVRADVDDPIERVLLEPGIDRETIGERFFGVAGAQNTAPNTPRASSASRAIVFCSVPASSARIWAAHSPRL